MKLIIYTTRAHKLTNLLMHESRLLLHDQWKNESVIDLGRKAFLLLISTIRFWFSNRFLQTIWTIVCLVHGHPCISNCDLCSFCWTGVALIATVWNEVYFCVSFYTIDCHKSRSLSQTGLKTCPSDRWERPSSIHSRDGDLPYHSALVFSWTLLLSVNNSNHHWGNCYYYAACCKISGFCRSSSLPLQSVMISLFRSNSIF